MKTFDHGRIPLDKPSEQLKFVAASDEVAMRFVELCLAAPGVQSFNNPKNTHEAGDAELRDALDHTFHEVGILRTQLSN
ncbi:MAG: hypothetical protein AAGB29_01520 [Planctomycetota bacterium]